MHVSSTYRPQNQILPQGNLAEILSYTFSAKEKDSETSLSYFGSRYYTSDLSIWLSVDPMSDKYPSLSPYVYCADNPIKLVDPNGEEIRIHYGNKGKFVIYQPRMKIRKKWDSFVKDVIIGLNFLYNHPENEKNRVEHLVTSELILEISKQDAGSSVYSGENRRIKWDNIHADVYEDGVQSPIIGLAHEIDHADRSFSAWEDFYYCQDNNLSDCDQYVEQMYSRDKEPAEISAMNYENFIGSFTIDGETISSKQRTEYLAPEKQIEVQSIFAIE